MKLHSEANVLEAARLAINHTRNDENIQKRMANYGFTQKRIQDGKVLLQKALMLQDTKTNHDEDRWVLSMEINANLETTKALFKDHVQVARTAFRNDPLVLHSLKIGRMATKRWEWLRQALHFYTQLEEQVISMKPYGISQGVLEQAKTSVASLLELKDDRTKKKGLAEDSTQEKKKAFQELKAWVVEFRGIARFAYKDNPQLLEIFGMMVPSVK